MTQSRYKTLAISLSLALLLLTPSRLSADVETLRTSPLTEVLKLSDVSFDSNPADFDIFTALYMDIWGMLPMSKLQTLSDGNQALTVFIPNDRAFRRVVIHLEDKTIKSEANIRLALLKLGEQAVEKILLYHVIPNATLSAATILGLPKSESITSNGSTLKFSVSGNTITLIDQKSKHTNPIVVSNKSDINSGNLQVAHLINQVLLP